MNDANAPDIGRLLLIGNDTVMHDLLRRRLSSAFDVSGEPCGHAAALAMARQADVDAVLVDADMKDADPAEVVAGIVLVCAAPLVTVSSAAGPGSAVSAALFQAGARAVVHKPAGRLPLDLDGVFGATLEATLRQVAAHE
jgi:chemotaxis response regulator CheB